MRGKKVPGPTGTHPSGALLKSGPPQPPQPPQPRNHPVGPSRILGFLPWPSWHAALPASVGLGRGVRGPLPSPCGREAQVEAQVDEDDGRM